MSAWPATSRNTGATSPGSRSGTVASLTPIRIRPCSTGSCALAINLSGASPGLAYHFVTAVIYCLGPVSLFWMAWRLCRSREVRPVRRHRLLLDFALLPAGGIRPRRYQRNPRSPPPANARAWGEGPHLLPCCSSRLPSACFTWLSKNASPGIGSPPDSLWPPFLSPTGSAPWRSSSASLRTSRGASRRSEDAADPDSHRRGRPTRTRWPCRGCRRIRSR